MPLGLSLASRTTCEAFRVGRSCNYRRLYACQGSTTRRVRRCMSASHARTSSTSATSSNTGPAAVSASAANDLVQYIVLRKDLWNSLQWPLGSIIAQACHASTAALWLSKDDDATLSYCAAERLDHMHKVSMACCTTPLPQCTSSVS